eukprot:7184318-Pyramimonas_sp.AAC.1
MCGSHQSQGGIEHILDVRANHREEESRGLRGERWEKAGSWTQAEKGGRGAMGVECTLAVIGTGGTRGNRAYSRCGSQSQGGIEHILDAGANHRGE